VTGIVFHQVPGSSLGVTYIVTGNIGRLIGNWK